MNIDHLTFQSTAFTHVSAHRKTPLETILYTQAASKFTAFLRCAHNLCFIFHKCCLFGHYILSVQIILIFFINCVTKFQTPTPVGLEQVKEQLLVSVPLLAFSNCIFCKQCVYVFSVVLTGIIACFQKQL